MIFLLSLLMTAIKVAHHTSIRNQVDETRKHNKSILIFIYGLSIFFFLSFYVSPFRSDPNYSGNKFELVEVIFLRLFWYFCFGMPCTILLFFLTSFYNKKSFLVGASISKTIWMMSDDDQFYIFSAVSQFNREPKKNWQAQCLHTPAWYRRFFKRRKFSWFTFFLSLVASNDWGVLDWGLETKNRRMPFKLNFNIFNIRINRYGQYYLFFDVVLHA